MKNSRQQWLKMAGILARKAKTETDPEKKAEILRLTRDARRLARAATDEAKGIDAKGKLGVEPSFDEETYRAMIPHLKAGVAHFEEGGLDIVEMVREMVRHFREQGKSTEWINAVKPYTLQFARDVRDGKESLDAPSVSNDLESDSGDGTPVDDMGGADVPAAGGATRSGSGPGTGVAMTIVIVATVVAISALVYNMWIAFRVIEGWLGLIPAIISIVFAPITQVVLPFVMLFVPSPAAASLSMWPAIIMIGLVYRFTIFSQR